VINDLEAWQRDNRNAGPVEIEKKTQELIALYEPPFRQRKIQMAFENINALYGNIATSQSNRPFGVTQPTEDNLQQVLGEIRTQVAERNGREDAAFRKQLMALQFSILMATGGR